MRQALVLSDKDNVATALADLAAGAAVEVEVQGSGRNVTLRADVPFGHKFALAALAAGEPVVKYGYPIGRTTAPVELGDHVHVHNVEGLRGRGDLESKGAG